MSSQTMSMTPAHNFNDMAVSRCTCTCKCRSAESITSSSTDSLRQEKKTSTKSWSEFAEDTTMHGVKYVNVSDSPKTTRSV